MHRHVVLLYFALVCAWAQAPKPAIRVLIIANQRYTKIAPVRNAEASANRIQKALAGVGVPDSAITVKKNLEFDQLKSTLEGEFVPSIKPGEVVVLYFAGHMLQADGENYFLGPSFDPAAKGPLQNSAYLASRFLDNLQESGASLSLLLFDGAFSESRLASIPGYSPGLKESPDLRNGIVLYSAGKEQLAPLPTTANPSPIADAFANLIAVKGIKMQDLATQLKNTVDQSSKGAQNPYMFANYSGGFRFTEPPVVEPPKPIIEIIRTGGPERKQHPSDRESYVLIPAGKFKMGCVDDSGCEANEKPRHEVTISKPFWLGESEVPVDAYERFTKMGGGSKMPRPPLGQNYAGWKDRALPMVMVSWADAERYCGWLGGRLPTEAEWEYAARGGVADQAYPMKDFSKARDAANFKGTSGNDIYPDIAPVRKFDRNPFGLYDMTGNVWEWVRDFYEVDYYSTSSAVDPTGPQSGKRRVLRGGSYDSDPKVHLRLSYRRPESPDGARYIGFRCMLPDSAEVRVKLQ